MKPLYIQDIKNCPEVILDKDKNKFEIKGISLPEDVVEFYNPILNWIDKYIKEPNQHTRFKIKLEYGNTASIKMIFHILSKLENIDDAAQRVRIEWIYEFDDEDMLKTGKDFSSGLDIPFVFHPYGDED